MPSLGDHLLKKAQGLNCSVLSGASFKNKKGNEFISAFFFNVIESHGLVTWNDPISTGLRVVTALVLVNVRVWESVWSRKRCLGWNSPTKGQGSKFFCTPNGKNQPRLVSEQPPRCLHLPHHDSMAHPQSLSLQWPSWPASSNPAGSFPEATA